MNTNESNATFGMSTVSATVGPTKGVRAMTAILETLDVQTLTSLNVETPAWATDRRTHLEEVGYRGLTFSRMVEVNENSPLVIEQDISEDDGNHGTYLVAALRVDLDWQGEANASDCRALAASLIEAADMLDSISAGVSI